jgi:UDP-N-acetyl-D-mannosaminuronic acid dehydrogenase
MELEQAVEELTRKIEEKKSTICIVGLGQVGLPTALSFLKANFKVVGYDINKNLVQSLLEGKSHTLENGFNQLITKFVDNRSFSLSTSPNCLDETDVVIISVPTPLDTKGSKADLTYLGKGLADVAKFLKERKLIVIESSIPPRTMKDYVIPTIEDLSNRKASKDFLISFCPERIAPGNSLQEFIENPRIIGANDDASYLATFALFKTVTKGKIYRADTTTAEISKLAENSYRYINIAFANELAIICEQSNADVMDVIRLANTHPRVNIHKPGPGVGGACLPKDPYLLIMGTRSKGSIVKTARSINDSMPTHVVSILMKNIGFSKKGAATSKVFVLGVSYKADVSDTRCSPTEGIILALRKKGFTDITVHDPYSADSFGAIHTNDLYSSLKQADCVIIATGHSLYSSINPQDFKKGSIIVDTARILDKRTFATADLAYLPLGS